MNNYQIDWLAKWAKYTPGKLFLREYFRNIEFSFKDFNIRASSLALYLKNELELKKGDRLAVYSKNCAEYVLLLLASIKAGVILVPLNFRLTPRELDVLIHDSGPSVLFYDAEYENEFKKLTSTSEISTILKLEKVTAFLTGESDGKDEFTADEFTFDDPVMILYTAGTTGVSKGVIINHSMLFWNAVNTTLRLDLTGNDHTQSFAPFFHTGGWNVLFTPFLFNGASHTLLNSFDAGLILELMEKEKTTIMFGVPTMLQMISDNPKWNETDLSTLRYAIVGGAPMPVPLIDKWHQKGIFIRQGYGLTEVGPNCFSLHQDDAYRKKGSIGFPNFYIETKVVRDDGSEANDNETGELWLRSPVVTPGYFNKPNETENSITDGWFHTGDMVLRDEEGYFYVVDRKKNMFISGGENVYPAEIERFLYAHGSFKEVAVIGVADSKWGETGKAFLVFKDGDSISIEEIKKYCLDGLAKYKIPKYFEILETLPKNDAGKIDKLKLNELHNQQINQLN
ncbi:MAG: AMP-binding protein [Ignavibacteriaceae bacterium]|nr:AMP-binding protein [Ignavibacteriaceae bacterium]